MSVICGFFPLNNNKSSTEYGLNMISCIGDIAVDKVEKWQNNELFLSCHHQFITSESTYEDLPYYDEEAKIAIVADAIIDNRKEMFDLLEIPSGEREKYTDGQLILTAYKKWGEDCCKYLLGDYTYAIYEEKTNKLVCTRDHVGKSTFYYTVNDSYFAFCTIMKPLIRIGGNKKINEQWVADFLSIPNVMMEMDTSLTVYQDIKQLPPAHTLVLKDKRISVSQYWDPTKAKKIRYKNDLEYGEAFREVLTESVRCKLRSIGNIGILLSGGFDSSTIGCIAAGFLQDEGKKLKSYTSIPMEGYVERFGENVISDESSFVNEINNMYPNIEAHFCRSDGKNSCNDIDRHLGILEQPYKTVENFFWISDIYEKAQNDNLKVLLNGHYGNVTISFSDFFMNFRSLLSSGRVFDLVHEIQMYSRNYGVGRKDVAKKILTGLIPQLHDFIYHNKGKDHISRSFPLVNPIFAEQNNEESRLNKARYGNKHYKSFSLNSYRKYISNHPMLSQTAVFEKKLDTRHNLITRDPTKDKRLIEFCYGIPGDQYIKNGRDKVILRRSMKGILPDTIRLNYTKKGIQAADWIQRIIPQWNEFSLQAKGCLSDKRIEKYINVEKVLKFLEENNELKLYVNPIDLRQVIVAYIFGKFILELDDEIS